MASQQQQQQPRILIAGAGVGGLSAALALHAVGYTDIHIFEAASTLTTLGVGINVQPSAVLILRNWGLLPALERTGIESQELNFYNRFGDSIVSEPRGKFSGYKVPQFSVHRGELQMLLLDAVKERLGADRVHLGHALDSWDQEDGGPTITAHFVRRGGGRANGKLNGDANGHAAPLEFPSMSGAVLIAADGINSTARKALYPHEGPPRFSGRILWRGCTVREPYLTGASMIWAGHADQKFIAYPIARREDGKSLVNWIAELRVRGEDDPDMTPPPADWTRPVEKSVFQGPFEGWKCGGLRMVEDLIEPTDKVYEFPMCDREPVDRWSFGRMTLLGDAAHAMYPIGSNGATQAVIDAETLAACVQESIDDLPAALTKYEQTRLPPTAKIVMANRANGPDHVLQLAHERAPDGFKNVYDVIPKEELEGIGATYKAIAGFDMENVNKKAAATEDLAARWK